MSEDTQFDPDEIDDGSNPVIKKVRDWGKAHAKKASDLEKQVAELSTKVAGFEAEKAQGALKGVAVEKGFSDEQVESLLALKPDLQPEQLDAFAKTFGIKAAEGEGEAPPKPKHTPSSGTTVPAPKISPAELDALYRRDPAAAAKALEEGKVELPRSPYG